MSVLHDDGGGGAVNPGAGRYVAFLRGMNLGRRRIKNVELCDCFSEMGFDDVSAFLASGNVIFGAAPASTDELAIRIEAGLERLLGYSVPTFVRTADEVRAIAACEPFDVEQIAAGGKLQVALLAREPDRAARETVSSLATEHDLLTIRKRELYWLPRGGVADSELDLAAIERAVGRMTVRIARTMVRLSAKLDD